MLNNSVVPNQQDACKSREMARLNIIVYRACRAAERSVELGLLMNQADVDVQTSHFCHTRSLMMLQT
jgi:hypothetical protein